MRELDSDFQALAAELRKLEGEYNMYFAGQLPRPPWETRNHVEAVLKRFDRAAFGNYADRFRFETLRSRYAAFAELWDRALRAREEGRPGPLHRAAAVPKTGGEAPDQVLHLAFFTDPMKEFDKVQELYDRLVEVRRAAGQPTVPFHKFALLVRDEVQALRKRGAPEVAFRLALKNGKIEFTARGMKGRD